MPTRDSSAQIDTDAAGWAARLDGEPLSDAEQQALDAWRSADPRRAGALARALAVLAMFDDPQPKGGG